MNDFNDSRFPGARAAIVDRSQAVAGVEEAMHAAVSRAFAASPLATMCAEHISSGGKRLRVHIALDAAVAVGAVGEWPIAWAAACELIHNATLIHDDVQDGDRVRRGQPSLWAKYGVDQAITAGDALLMLPYALIAESDLPRDRVASVVQCLARRAAETARGQSVELAMNAQRTVDRGLYTAAARGKTGQFFALPVEGAAIGAGWSPAEARRVGDLFEDLGAVFQMADDVVDLFGAKGRGRVGCDVYEGKVSALVVEHLERTPTDIDWLLGILQLPRDATYPEDVMSVRYRFQQSGAYAAVVERIERGKREVGAALDDLGCHGLHVLADAILSRATQSLVPDEHAPAPPCPATESSYV